MIHTSLSPNLTTQDVLIALKYLLFPWRWRLWKYGKHINEFEQVFKDYLKVSDAVSFDSGRSALLCALKALGIGQGDEVLLQAYTCVVVPNAVKFASAVPIFVDIENDSFHMDIFDLQKKITSRSKVVIIQNIFGDPDKYDEIIKIAKKQNLFIIEDCAHALGVEYKGKKLGTIGDASIFSFGRDKVISSVYGGMAVSKRKDIALKIRSIQQKLPFPSCFALFQHLFHTLIFALAVPSYTIFSLGKFTLYLAQKLRLISKILLSDEKKGKLPDRQPAKLANCLSEIALHQMTLLEKFNSHRYRIAQAYYNHLHKLHVILPKIGSLELVSRHKGLRNLFLRFTILSNDRDKIMKLGKKMGILFGNWYDSVIAPKDIDLKAVGYKLKSCPNAEKKAQMSLNLPNHYKITMDDVKKVCEVVEGGVRG